MIGFSARCGLDPHSITKLADSKQIFLAPGRKAKPGASDRPGYPLSSGLRRGNTLCSYGLMMVASRAERPFQAIWTPMQSRIKAITRRIPWAVEGGMILVILGA